MESLKFTLFGGVAVTRGGQPITDFVSRKALALLCYLAVNRRPHPRPVLQALLWGEAPETDAANSLRNALSNVRKLTGEQMEITRQAAGFRPEAQCWVDVEVLQVADRITAEPEGALSAAQIEELEAAILLYQGEFMAGFSVEDASAFEEWLLAERERLRLAYLKILHRLVQHYSQAGLHERAIERNSQLLSVEPWKEEAHRQQMLLLARAGRWSEALAQFRLCRELLSRELDVEPMPETLALYERIRIARELPRNNLSGSLPQLIGRKGELKQILSTLRDPECRLLTISGPGGAGKTRLAQEVIVQVATDYLHGARFVPLVAVSSPSYLDTAMASALGIRLQPEPSPRQQLLDQLKPLEQLIVLDNLDHLLDETGLILDILEHAPDVKILVTSRERLNLRAEWLFALGGLADPTGGAEDLVGFDYPSLQLFLREARRARPDLQLLDETSVGAICRLLEGMPLGIELAAAQIATLSVQEVELALRESLDALAVSWPDVPERHRSLRAVFSQSWERLSPEARSVLARLSVFPGSFDIPAAAAIAGLTAGVLAELSAKSFLRSAGIPGRFESHEVLRQYAAEALAGNPDEAKKTRQAHICHFAQLLASQESRFTSHLDEVMAILRPDLDNFRLAWQGAIEREDWDSLLLMVGSLHRFYEAQTWYQEGYELFQQLILALKPRSKDRRVAWGRLLSHAAGLLFRLGRIAEGKELAEESVLILKESEAPEALALGLNTLGILQIHSGEFARAQTSLQAGIKLYRELGMRGEIVRPLANLGSAYSREGKYIEGLAALEEGLAICRDIGDRRGEALFLNNIAANHLMQGREQEALPYLESCLPICEAIGFNQLQQIALYNLGEIYLNRSEPERTLAYCRLSAEIADQLHDPLSLARALKLVGVAETRLRKFTTARSTFEQALAAAAGTDSLPTVMDVLDGIVTYLQAVGLMDQALELLQLVADHPATESQYQDRARLQLKAAGWAQTGASVDLESRLRAVIEGFLKGQ